jgi:glycosyltransferase involved in cell wall biosynthesis
LWNNDYYLSRKKSSIYKDLNIELITPSIWLKKLVHKTSLGEKKIHYIPNGIDLEKFKYKNPSTSRIKFSFANAPLVLFVGADSVANVFKGFGDFLLASRIIQNINNNIQFVCLGAKKDGFIENIRLIQATANKDQISEIMSCADVLVLSSKYENFPLVVLEALAIGVPVVSYKVGGIPELLSSSEDSVLIEPGNVQLLAKGIMDVLSKKNGANKALRRKKNRLLIASKCDIKNIAKKYINIFQLKI